MATAMDPGTKTIIVFEYSFQVGPEDWFQRMETLMLDDSHTLKEVWEKLNTVQKGTSSIGRIELTKPLEVKS